jgi:hypothetical protein
MEFNNYSNKISKIKIRDARGSIDEIELDAFLTSFNNSITSTWSEETVYGRQDVIGTYQSTKRKISFGVNVVSYDINSAKENMKKINNLTLMLYPTYNSSNTSVLTGVQPPLQANEISVSTNALTLSKVPLVYLKFGNLIHEISYDLLGWINSFTANPVLDMGMFLENGDMFPKIWDVSIDFTPQHQQMIGVTKSMTGMPNFPYNIE